jgi:membrane protein required for colicin V production
MNWTDYIIIGVLALSVFVGLWRGLISEVMALAIWIAAFWVAWTFGPMVAERFRQVIELPSARIIVGYGLCFVAVLILGALLRFVIGKLIESTGLSGTDRLLGMLIGFTAFTRDPWWQRSVLLPRFQHVAAWLSQQVPPSVREYLHPPAVLGRLHGLPAALPAPISGTTPAPAASVMRPAVAASTAGPSPTF